MSNQLIFVFVCLLTSYISRWRHFYGPNGPRPRPTLNMWPADTIGVIHEVNSSNGYWQCDGISMDCQDTTPVTAKLEVVSTRPKVFIIDKFLSDHEAEHIKFLAAPKVKESTVGNDSGGGVLSSSTRTSLNTWIPRASSRVTDTISRRVADVLGLDEAILWTNKNVEDMQVCALIGLDYLFFIFVLFACSICCSYCCDYSL